jgi:hypothetical protein
LFETEYHPVNFRIDPWIDIDIEWEKGEPMNQTQLYCITIKKGNLHNGPIIRYRENGIRINPIDYTINQSILDL